MMTGKGAGKIKRNLPPRAFLSEITMTQQEPDTQQDHESSGTQPERLTPEELEDLKKEMKEAAAYARKLRGLTSEDTGTI